MTTLYKLMDELYAIGGIDLVDKFLRECQGSDWGFFDPSCKLLETPGTILVQAFCWAESANGNNYWDNIWLQLGS